MKVKYVFRNKMSRKKITINVFLYIYNPHDYLLSQNLNREFMLDSESKKQLSVMLNKLAENERTAFIDFVLRAKILKDPQQSFSQNHLLENTNKENHPNKIQKQVKSL